MIAGFRLPMQPHLRLHQHKEVVVLANGHHGLDEEALRAEDLVVVQNFLALVEKVANTEPALGSTHMNKIML
jgi:hypothetical protein